MKISLLWSAAALALCASSCNAQNPPASTPVTSNPSASRGLLLATDFDSTAWPEAAAMDASKGVTAQFAVDKVGTIDTYKGQPSSALTLSADFSKAQNAAEAQLSSGVLDFKNSETSLSKITLGFDAWQSEVHPIRVVVQSLDAAGQVTGARVATVLPPVSAAWYRFTLDWDKTRPLSGTFDPVAAKIRLSFGISDEDGTISRTQQILRLDNVSISVPALYVGVNGKDSNDGRTEKTAFATIQKAVDSAVAGDVISILSGTYHSAGSAAYITKSGAPAAWITLRANPGSRPELSGDGWDVIKFEKAPAYWEIRGLTIKGTVPTLTLTDALADGLLKQKDGKPYYGDGLYNSNGISIFDRSQPQEARPHHIRIVDNDVVDNTGGGISAINCDYVTIEGNRVRNNCHFMRYGGSGISVFRSWNFDDSRTTRMFVVGNVANGNRTFVPWSAIGKISDGNGIIIDDNINSQTGASKIRYEGRTLVQNNLSYGNGGSGIHAYASRFVDIVNNTAYYNAQSPELSWRQIFAGGECDDVRVFNNILYAPKGRPLNFSTAKSSTNIVYADNLFFGDGDNAVQGGGGLGSGSGGVQTAVNNNVEADPKFVKPSLDAKIADFRLAPGSPGIDRGSVGHPGTPRNDLLGHKRPQGSAPDVGAYEMSPAD